MEMSEIFSARDYSAVRAAGGPRPLLPIDPFEAKSMLKYFDLNFSKTLIPPAAYWNGSFFGVLAIDNQIEMMDAGIEGEAQNLKYRKPHTLSGADSDEMIKRLESGLEPHWQEFIDRLFDSQPHWEKYVENYVSLIIHDCGGSLARYALAIGQAVSANVSETSINVARKIESDNKAAQLRIPASGRIPGEAHTN
ncbi:hypothetical protein N7536_002692 [Penicillium majusculum]|nr:hypothetical protein N7536_002692 [Penicillium majusculum]